MPRSNFASISQEHFFPFSLWIKLLSLKVMTSQTVGSFQAARESDKYKSNVWPRGNQGGKRLRTKKQLSRLPVLNNNLDSATEIKLAKC